MSHKELDKDEYLTGQCWHEDATGRKETPALKTGTLLGILFRDRQSRYYAGYSVKNNDSDEILHVVEKWDSEELVYWRNRYLEAYWTFKDYFPLDGIAQSLIGHCHSTMDLPAAWHLFN